tara:strand:- start:318 stop:1250 length:933 start_codon:yes stop_codon:yes gene_type:complete
MNDIEPINQTKLYGLDKYFNELIYLYERNILPNKILLSGQKGIGKSTLAYHFINYVLSLNEYHKYDLKNFNINSQSSIFKTIQNNSNPNFIKIDVSNDKKLIDINQIRDLISLINKSSFNDKPRFILIDNIEYLNVNSINALLKILEEPNQNVNFLLINNNKKILSTLLSRCINFRINLSYMESAKIIYQLLNKDLENLINKDFVNYYSTPGYVYGLVQFSQKYNFDLLKLDLKNFLKILIQDNYYKKDNFITNMIYSLIEFYLRKPNQIFSKLLYEKYNYFVRRISDTKIYNLDKDLLFAEFTEEILDV